MELHLAEPPAELDDFPERTLPAGAHLWTVHPADRWAWVCSSGGDGRFDLAAPHGACYFSLEPLGALIECCFRETPEIDEGALRERRLSVMTTDVPLRLADFTNPRAFGYGVTAEIHCMPDYELTQRWARALHDAGFDGVHYLLRHDPSLSLAGVARFGREGERREWPAPRTEPFGEELLRQAVQRLGVRVRTR